MLKNDLIVNDIVNSTYFIYIAQIIDIDSNVIHYPII